jgi:hypothetical protein
MPLTVSHHDGHRLFRRALHTLRVPCRRLYGICNRLMMTWWFAALLMGPLFAELAVRVILDLSASGEPQPETCSVAARLFDDDFDLSSVRDLFTRPQVAWWSRVWWSVVWYVGFTLLHLSALTLCALIDCSLRRLYRHARSTA